MEPRYFVTGIAIGFLLNVLAELIASGRRR